MTTMTAALYQQITAPVSAFQYRGGMDCGELHIAIDALTDGKAKLILEFPGRKPFLVTSGNVKLPLSPGQWVVLVGTTPRVYSGVDFRRQFVAQSLIDAVKDRDVESVTPSTQEA